MLLFIYFWLYYAAYGIIILWPEIEHKEALNTGPPGSPQFILFLTISGWPNRIFCRYCYKEALTVIRLEHCSGPTKYLGLRFSPRILLCVFTSTWNLLQLVTLNHPCQFEESGAVWGLHQGILWLSSSWRKSTWNHFSLTLSVPQRHGFVSAPVLCILFRFLHV